MTKNDLRLGLVLAICGAMDAYTAAHEMDGGWNDIFSALDTVLEIYEDTRDQRVAVDEPDVAED